jgi:integrase
MWPRLDGANRSTPYGHVADAQAHPGQQAATHARLHDLRHLHATTLLLSGVPVHVVAAASGTPTRLFTLRVYAHVIRSAEAAAADIFADPVNAAC